jgi:hypothetical protein
MILYSFLGKAKGLLEGTLIVPPFIFVIKLFRDSYCHNVVSEEIINSGAMPYRLLDRFIQKYLCFSVTT